jgi:hypothetical protein
MSTSFPQQTSRYWGQFANAGALPGVGAAEINLKAGDYAYTADGSIFACMNATFPAVWTAPGNAASVRVAAGNTDTLLVTDVIVEYTFAGPVAVTIPAGLSPGTLLSRTLLLQQADPATQLTITPPGGGSIDGAASVAYAAGIGAVPLRSKAGSSTVWYSGAPLLAPPVNTVAPVISGSVGTIGATLATTNGTWTGAVTFTYQWQKAGLDGIFADIGGATSTTSPAQAAGDQGPGFRCRVTATNTTGSTSAFSNVLAYTPTGDTGVVDWFDPLPLTPGSVSPWTGTMGVVALTEATNKPVASQTSINNTPGVTGNGTNQKLAGPVNLSGGHAARIVGAFIDSTAVLSGMFNHAGSIGSVPGSFDIYANDNAGRVSAYTRGATGSGGARTTNTDAPLTLATVVTWCPSTDVVDGCAFIRVNGTSVALTAIQNLTDPANLASGTFVAFRDEAVTFWAGTMGAWAIMSGNAQDAALDRVERFCAYRAAMAVW